MFTFFSTSISVCVRACQKCAHLVLFSVVDCSLLTFLALQALPARRAQTAAGHQVTARAVATVTQPVAVLAPVACVTRDATAGAHEAGRACACACHRVTLRAVFAVTETL